MSIFRALIRASQDDQQRGPADDFWYRPVGNPTSAGVVVNPEVAMRLSTVYACVRVLTETISTLPIELYQKKSDGTRIPAVKHPCYGILTKRPNIFQSRVDFYESMVGHMALRGTNFSRIDHDYRGNPIALTPLHPDNMKVEQLDSGRLRYTYRKPQTNITTVYLQEDILRAPLIGDGITGLSPVSQVREAIGLALNAQNYAARFFSNDARPGGILSSPNAVDDESYQNIKQSWNEAHAGADNSHKVAILEEGMTWQAIGVTPDEAQFLQTRQYTRGEIASVYRIPPHMIGDLENAHLSNIEQQSIDFVIHCVRPWLVRIEQAIARDLYPDDDDIYLAFNVEGLLRGDSQARALLYRYGILDGWLTRNEVREKENLPPLKGLDQPLTPLNMTKEMNREGDQTPPGATPMDKQPPAAPRKNQDGAFLTPLLIEAAQRPTRMFAADLKKKAKHSEAAIASWWSKYESGLGQFFTSSMHTSYAAARSLLQDDELTELPQKHTDLFLSACRALVNGGVTLVGIDKFTAETPARVAAGIMEDFNAEAL